MSLQIVKDIIKQHPEIDLGDEEERGKLVDFVAEFLNPIGSITPYGRKSRNKEGTDLNSDGLTKLLSDDMFMIYDIIVGSPQPKDEHGNFTVNRENHYASWTEYGPFKQGENGYWVPIGGEPDEEPTGGPSHLEIDVKNLKNELAAIKQELAKCIKEDDKIGLMTENDFFICAESAGREEVNVSATVRYSGNVNATRLTLGPWETLKVKRA